MRIQLASDLHLEHLDSLFPGERLIVPAHQADVLVLAGDIANGSAVVDLFGDWPTPVVAVMGNHECYGLVYEDVLEQLRERARGTSVHFLERDVADFGGVRFLGATMWTDYRYRCGLTQSQIMAECQRRIRDHHVISTRDGTLFSPQRALAIHDESREWLRAELLKPYDGVTVVVSHHGPHPLSIHPRYAGMPINGGFSSDLSDLLHHADFWLHGHTHDSFDYRMGRCRVVVNPRGYALDRYNAADAASLRFENPNFKHALLVDTYDVPRPLKA